MKKFNTIEEAKAYGSEHLGKREQELVLVNGEKTILCGTCLVYEDFIWNQTKELFDSSVELFDCLNPEDDPDEGVYGASLIRDAVIKALEEVFDCKIVTASDTY